MNSIHGSEALAIATLAVVLLSGFLFYIFRQSSKLTGNKPSTAKILANMGTALKSYEEGRYRDALAQWPELIQDSERTGNILWVLAATNMLGHTLEKLGEYEEAARAYKSSMTVGYREQTADSLRVAYRRYCMCELILGRPEEAGKALRDLSEIYRLEGDIEKAIRNLAMLADTFRKQGYLEHAAAAYEDALRLADRFEQQDGRAMVLHDQSLFLRSMGQLAQALECAQQAAQIRLAATDLENQPRLRTVGRELNEMKTADGRAHMLCTTANLLRQIGKIEEARADYVKALEIAARFNSQKFIGIAELEGSLIAWATGQREEARALLRNAVEAAAADEESEDRKPVNAIIEASYSEQSGDAARALIILAITSKLFPTLKPHVKSGFLNVQARALAKNKQHEEAAATLERATVLAAKLKAPLYLAENAFTAGVVALYRGDHDEADRRLQQALSFYHKSGFKRETANTQRYRAAALLALGRTEDSAAASADSRRLYQEMGDHASAAEV
jgi:tetratricopeptide (TPR) repeat protein